MAPILPPNTANPKSVPGCGSDGRTGISLNSICPQAPGYHAPGNCGVPICLTRYGSAATDNAMEDPMKTRYTFLILTLVATGAAGGLVMAGSAAGSGPRPGPGEPTLAEVRRLTERFRDVNVALAEGYVRDPFNLCDTADDDGPPRIARRDGHPLLPSRPARHHGAAFAASRRHRHAHRFPPAEHPDLRTAGRWLAGAGRRREPGLQGRLARAQAMPSRRHSTVCRTTRWWTIPAPRSTRRTCSSRTSIAMSGSIATTRTVSSRSSIPP